MEKEEIINILWNLKREIESKNMILFNNSSNLNITWSPEEMKQMADAQNKRSKRDTSNRKSC